MEVERIRKALEGKVGEPVLLINSQIEEFPRGGNPCWGGGGRDLFRKDYLELGILTEGEIKEGKREVKKPHIWDLKGLEIPSIHHVIHEPEGYEVLPQLRLFVRRDGNVIIPQYGELIIGAVYEPITNPSFSRLQLLVGEEVPDFFNRGGIDRSLKDDFYLDISYVHALKLLGREDLAPEKFKVAYEKFVKETTEEVLSVLGGEKKDKFSGLRERAIIAGLDKSPLEISLGGGHYVKVAQAIQHLR